MARPSRGGPRAAPVFVAEPAPVGGRHRNAIGFVAPHLPVRRLGDRPRRPATVPLNQLLGSARASRRNPRAAVGQAPQSGRRPPRFSDPLGYITYIRRTMSERQGEAGPAPEFEGSEGLPVLSSDAAAASQRSRSRPRSPGANPEDHFEAGSGLASALQASTRISGRHTVATIDRAEHRASARLDRLDARG
ncbi:hypothetical protein AKJ08_1304 [Vulgatibacter incomptus]|uniref:Uncharacterized protein n=1 Tax=Vulgatibacter incomptus TaxID=1391653 RepID=A0A0K1PBP2_9BACT|nr:hypothetical protein AKJ08_1304 [Vulgatibacter incomptus]